MNYLSYFGLREMPFGSPPSNARERRKVVRLESAWAKAVAGASTPRMAAASRGTRREGRILP